MTQFPINEPVKGSEDIPCTWVLLTWEIWQKFYIPGFLKDQLWSFVVIWEWASEWENSLCLSALSHGQQYLSLHIHIWCLVWYDTSDNKISWGRTSEPMIHKFLDSKYLSILTAYFFPLDPLMEETNSSSN